jgi:hypothetical protein
MQITPAGEADLLLRDGTFYLYVTVDLPSAPIVDAQETNTD